MAREIDNVMSGDVDRFQARLDHLLSSALEEKAREEKALVETLRGVRFDVARMQQELSAVRQMVEQQGDTSLGTLKQQVAALTGRINDIPSQLEESNEAYSAAVIKRILGESAQLQGAVEASSTAAAERLSIEGNQIRKAIAAVEAQIETSVAALQQTIENRMSEIPELIETRLDNFSSLVIAGLEESGESLTNDIEVAQEAILQHVTDTQQEAADKAAAVTQRLKAFIAKGMTNVITEAFVPFLARMESAAGALETAEHDIGESRRRVEGMQNALIAFLQERDERLEHTRDEAFLDLAQKVSESLGRRGGKKMADAVQEAQTKRQNERDARRYRELKGATGSVPETRTVQPYPPAARLIESDVLKRAPFTVVTPEISEKAWEEPPESSGGESFDGAEVKATDTKDLKETKDVKGTEDTKDTKDPEDLKDDNDGPNVSSKSEDASEDENSDEFELQYFYPAWDDEAGKMPPVVGRPKNTAPSEKSGPRLESTPASPKRGTRVKKTKSSAKPADASAKPAPSRAKSRVQKSK